MYVCAPHAFLVPRYQKMLLDSLKWGSCCRLELREQMSVLFMSKIGGSAGQSLPPPWFTG